MTNDAIESDDDLFNPADFESIDLVVLMKHTATGKIWDEKSKIAIIEVGDQMLTLSLPANSVTAGTNVMIEIYHGENMLLRSTAKIKSVSEASVGTMSAQVELVQFEMKTWEDFLKVFSSRQEEISRFFEMGKK